MWMKDYDHEYLHKIEWATYFTYLPFYPNYWDTFSYHTHPKHWTSPFYDLLMSLKTAGWVANSEDSDQMPHGSDLRQYCLLRPVRPNS